MKNHLNRLSLEPSLYLRQHAHNPVDWYPWGPEAFEVALSQNKPVLVSIGYSACHWCHVMERESFEDQATAELMNSLLVNIKVDREERPDLDQIYMDAVQAMTGSGGWPLNVFLTPEKKPFFGGTYFPPVPTGDRMSWKQLLMAVSEAFRDRRTQIEEQAGRLTLHLGRDPLTAGSGGQASTPSLETRLVETIMAQADSLYGGFGGAPKFPSTFLLRILLHHYRTAGDKMALEHLKKSLDHMIAGGIYDHVGGGFCRYATDRAWMVPHFEKMLYDNALLVELISEAYQLTRDSHYAHAVARTLEYVSREMSDPEGGFYSSLDADSQGAEGKYYVWSYPELEELLGKDCTWFCAAFGALPEGNWEGVNILHRIGTAIPGDGKEEELLGRLLSRRELRERPQRDEKVLLGWNALMCTAYCRAYAAFGDPSYRDRAVANERFIHRHMTGSGKTSLFHCWQDGKPRQAAFLDDYAFLIQALISLQEVTANRDYLLRARDLTDEAVREFWDEEKGLFCFASSSREDLIVRRGEIYDGATPSGNAVMCRNLRYLAVVFSRDDYERMASRMASATAEITLKYPSSFGVWALGLLESARG
ncbi:MAG TPA: thioredoxin domain-containing protein, partial [Chitinophagaceae bacterium]|nr:thioredoxin domain-containing protein [Chitinophagaceae bacterium]